MYERFAESRGWKVQVLSSSPSEAGGFKTIEFKVTGEKVYSVMKFESGVHRVQRVPKTESQGRIQTSTATVAVLPEADDIDIQINQEDLRIDTYCASDQEARELIPHTRLSVLHTCRQIPWCSHKISAHRYKTARFVCRCFVPACMSRELERQQAEQGADRLSQIGHGARSEKIRTYNQPQDRVTDHRIGFNGTYNGVLLGDTLPSVIESLAAAERAEARASRLIFQVSVCKIRAGRLNVFLTGRQDIWSAKVTNTRASRQSGCFRPQPVSHAWNCTLISTSRLCRMS